MSPNEPMSSGDLSSIGSRLRDERERLGYSQSRWCELCGTTRKTQFLYETDARRPDADYLAAAAEARADVLFIVTGATEQTSPKTLTGEEQALVQHYRAAPPAVRKAALAALLSALPHDTKAKD